jgi:hypothetical protein
VILNLQENGEETIHSTASMGETYRQLSEIVGRFKLRE